MRAFIGVITAEYLVLIKTGSIKIVMLQASSPHTTYSHTLHDTFCAGESKIKNS